MGDKMRRNKGQISALHIAYEKGQILPAKEGRFLVGGAEITRAEILPERKQGVVEGKMPTGGVFQISVSTRVLRPS